MKVIQPRNEAIPSLAQVITKAAENAKAGMKEADVARRELRAQGKSKK
jgi:hypothetical protein